MNINGGNEQGNHEESEKNEKKSTLTMLPCSFYLKFLKYENRQKRKKWEPKRLGYLFRHTSPLKR